MPAHIHQPDAHSSMEIEWISMQTGTSAEMIRRRYGKWMLEDADDKIAQLEAKLGL